MELEEGVAEDVGMMSLGSSWSEAGGVVVEDRFDKEGRAPRVVGGEGLGFGVHVLPVSDGSIAENKVRQQIR